MDVSGKRRAAPRPGGRLAAAWLVCAVLLVPLLLGGCSRLLSLVDPAAF